VRPGLEVLEALAPGPACSRFPRSKGRFQAKIYSSCSLKRGLRQKVASGAAEKRNPSVQGQFGVAGGADLPKCGEIAIITFFTPPNEINFSGYLYSIADL
jgi:hypothetical protein